LLLKETLYKTNVSIKRLIIYSTNDLEEYHSDTGILFSSWLSDEANEANYIKRNVLQSKSWKIENVKSLAKNFNKLYIQKVSYCPFDVGVYYDEHLIERSRIKVMQHFINGENMGGSFKLGHSEENSAPISFAKKPRS